MIGYNTFLPRTLVAICAFAIVISLGPISQATTIFQEDWNSYTGFPGSPNDIGNHRTNFGVPTQAEGADNDWLAGRFEAFDSNPLVDDVGVLKYGNGAPGGAYGNPAGRVSDDGGLVAQIDLTGFVDAELSFDWRTFATETTDRLVVAYYIGDDLGTPGAAYDWFNDPALGNGDMTASDPQGQANTWYVNNWVEVFRGTSPSGFQQESGIALPGTNNRPIYLAFWLDNGDHDLGKIDNIVVTAEEIPEPTGVTLMLLAGCLFLTRRK